MTIDQAVAGASNVLILVFAARVLPVAAFGLFGIVFLAYGLALGVTRALVSDPLLIHPLEADRKTAEIVGTSCLLGLGLGSFVLLSGLVTDVWNAQLGGALIVLGVCIPLLMIQDLGRYLGFASQRPGLAVVLDAVWLVALIGGVVALAAGNAHSLTLFVAMWGGLGAATGLLVFWQHRVMPRLGLSWLRFSWGYSWRYLISYGSAQGTALAGTSAVGAILGTRALGAIQGSILLVRPYATFQVAAIAAGITEIARSLGDDAYVRRYAVKISRLATTIALLNGFVLLVLPDDIGMQILGATWEFSKPLLLPTAVQLVFLGLITGARAGLLGMRAIHRAMVIDVVSTFFVFGAIVSGALINGALGALWAVAGAQGVITGFRWLVFLRYTDNARRQVIDHVEDGNPSGDVGDTVSERKLPTVI